MGFRELVIAAAAVEIFSPGSIERGAKSAISTFATMLRNMPPASPHPHQFNQQSTPLPEVNWERCPTCGEEKFLIGRCWGACLRVSLAVVKADLKKAGRQGRRALPAPPVVDVKPEQGPAALQLPTSSGEEIDEGIRQQREATAEALKAFCGRAKAEREREFQRGLSEGERIAAELIKGAPAQQPEAAMGNDRGVPTTMKKGRRKGNPNEVTKAKWRMYRQLSSDSTKTRQEKIRLIAKKFRKDDQGKTDSERSAGRAIATHFPCDGCEDCTEAKDG